MCRKTRIMILLWHALHWTLYAIAEERSLMSNKIEEILQDLQIDDGPFKKSTASYIRPCYFTNWAQYRPGRGKFMPEDYIPGLCTHILYAFGWMNDDFTVRAYDPSDLDQSWAQGMYSRVNQLKKQDHNLKTLLSFGGWTFGTWLFKSMAQTLEGRKTFIDSAIAFVRQHDFDGIDIDWEYPEGSEDMENYSKLIKELRLAVETESANANRERLLVTAAVAAGNGKIDNGYDVPEISKYFDFVLLMAYDFHGAWEEGTDFNSPLFSRPDEDKEFQLWNVNAAANYWVTKGMPKEKLIIGLATYARGWTLKDPTNSGIGAPTSGAAKSTKYVREGGVASYYEICEMIANGAETHFSTMQQVPYLVHGDQWFSYDDEQSFRIKLKWLKSQGYGGAFVWTLDFDDFNCKCSNGNGKKYPLINTIIDELKNGTPSPPPPPSGTTKKPATPGPSKPQTTPRPPPQGNSCSGKHDGFYGNPADCTAFTLCVDGQSYPMECPAKFFFSHKMGYCVHPENSECKREPTPEIATSARPTVPEITTSTAHPESFTCPGDGFYPDPTTCDHFFRCMGGTPHKFACPGNLCFDSKSKLCNYPSNCDCKLNEI